MSADEVIASSQAIELLGVARSTFWNLVRRENVTRYQKPADARSVYFRRSDIEVLTVARPVPADAR
jgi:predicted DNA-binding transcriptional regulator AlpA